MNKSRRAFMSSAAGCVATATYLLATGSVAGSKTPLGHGELTILSDGNLVLPSGFVLPDTLQSVETDLFLTENNLNTPQRTPDCNLALWRNQDRLVIFDVGAGSNFMPSAGKVLNDLEAMSIDPSDISDVVFTHGHPDHLWGLIDDFDELMFPEANYYMNATEWDYWRDKNTINKLPEARKAFAVGAQNRLAYLDGKINLFNYGDELLSGLEAVDTHGHTPGHTSFALHQGSDSLLVLGDALTHPIISFQKASWPSGSDQDPEASIKTRLSLLDRLSQDKMQIVGFHLPHPGVGMVEKTDSHYRYIAG